MTLLNPSARFVLAHKTRKANCPQCGKRRFRLYVDTMTGELLPDHVGICDRENNCQYRHTALEWIKHGGNPPNIEGPRERPAHPPRNTSYRINNEAAQAFQKHEENTLLQWMSEHMDLGRVLSAFERYGIGTYTGAKAHLKGATIFWQRDLSGELRTAEIIVYQDGHRSKVPGHHTWAHYLITGKRAGEIGVGECLFGEHLLRNWSMNAWVGIVESAKSALICSLFYPEVLWLACRSMDGLTLDKCLPLAGRKVCLFPDAGKGFASWSNKAPMIEPAVSELVVCDILECLGFCDGEDLADCLLPNNLLAAMAVDIIPMDPGDEQPEEEERLELSHGYPPILQRMIARNPAIATLISECDLDTDNIRLS
jgi:hypothetical protein